MSDEFDSIDRLLGYAEDPDELEEPAVPRGVATVIDRVLEPPLPSQTDQPDAVDRLLGYEVVEPDTRGVVEKGFSSGVNALVSIFGGAASFTGDVFNIDSLQGWGRDISREYGDRAAQDAQGVPVTLDQVFSSEDQFDAFWRWAAFNATSGGVTALPALAVGALGAVTSPLIALGAGGAFLYGMGVGDITATQLEAKDDPDLRWAAVGGVPYAIAERMFGAGARAARMLTGAQKRQLATTYLKRLAREVPFSVGSEATAEGIQTVITEGVRRLESGEPVEDVLSDADFWRQVGEGAAAGGVAGAPFGGLGAIPGPGVLPEVPVTPAPGEPPVAPERPITRPPDEGLAPGDRESPLSDADIARGHDIIGEAAGPIGEGTPEVVLDPDTELPARGSQVRALSRELPGRAVEGQVVESFEVDGLPGIAIRDAQGITHYIDQGAAQFQPVAPPQTVRQQVRQPAPELTDEDRASPIEDAEIQRGQEIIEDAIADTDVNKVLSAAGLPGVRTRVSVQTPRGTTLLGEITDAIQDGDEVQLVVRDEAGRSVEVPAGSTVTRLPTEAEVAEQADLGRIREERDRLEADATAQGLGGTFQQAEINELGREGVDTFDELPRERQKPVIAGIKTQVSEAQKRQKEAEKAATDEQRAQQQAVKDEEAGRKFSADIFQASQGVAPERADQFIRQILDEEGYAELGAVEPERRSGVIRTLKASVKQDQDARKAAEQAAAEEEAARAAAEKQRQADEKADEKATADRQKEADARLVFQQDVHTAFEEAKDLGGDFMSEAEGAVRKEMGIEPGYQIGADTARRSTYLKLFAGKVAAERRRRQQEERETKAREVAEVARQRQEEEARKTRERQEAEAQAKKDKEEREQKAAEDLRKAAEEREKKERETAEAAEAAEAVPQREPGQTFDQWWGETLTPAGRLKAALEAGWNESQADRIGKMTARNLGPDNVEVLERKFPEVPRAEPKEPEAPEAPEEAPERPEGYGKANKVFTEDAAEKARETLRKKLTTELAAGVDPEILQAGITLAGYHIEAGTRSFADYSKAMIADLGEAARPYLRSWYEGVRHYPGFDSEGMTPAADIEAEPPTEAEPEPEAPAAEEAEPQPPTETEAEAEAEPVAEEEAPVAPEEPPVAPKTPKLQDAGDKLEGRIRKRQADIDKIKAEKDSDERAIDKLLEITARANVWKVDVPAEATPGTAPYIEAVRGHVRTFLRQSLGYRKVKRADLVDRWEYMRDAAYKEAPSYIAALETLKEATDGALTVDQAVQALRELILGPKILAEWNGRAPFSIGSEDLTAFGKVFRNLLEESYQLSKLLNDENNYGLVRTYRDMTDATKTKPIKRPAIAFGPEGPDRGDLSDWRNGKDVSGEDLVEAFGFRGIEYGDWVTGVERQRLTNYAYDAFQDLAHRLGISPKDISLGGTLGFAFGSRGRGRHSAHYEPDTQVIALTKTRGDGSIAHEWGHALDYHLQHNTHGANTVTDIKRHLKETYSEARAFAKLRNLLAGRSWVRGDKRRGPLETARYYIKMRLWEETGWGTHWRRDFYGEAYRLGEYWRRPQELFARSFESWVNDGMTGPSPFLVNDYVAEGVVSKKAGYKGTPYPTGQDRTDFADMWQELFDKLEWTTKGPTLKSAFRPQGRIIDQIAEAMDKADLEYLMKEAKDDGGTTGRDVADEQQPVDETGGEAVETGAADDGEAARRGRATEPGAEDGGGRDRGADVRDDEQGRGADRGEGTGDQREPAASGRDGGSGASGGSRSPGAPGTNYRITDADNLGSGGQVEKARLNIEAIRTLKKIQAEKRLATPEEQAVLVRYVGWGGLKNVFGYGNPALRKYGEELKELVTPEEFEAARATVLNAHYTSGAIIKSMWTATERLGFKGGRVLEPGAGIGHFIGLMPNKLLAESTVMGVEIDATSAAIASQLYQRAQIVESPYQDTAIPEGFYDLAISNVPFSDVAPADRKYNKAKLNLHDYYFRKSIRMVRPGGLVAFVTSKGTMDKVQNRARELVGEDAWLVGAIRLPENAFEQNAGTIVTTDIIFLRRKVLGEEQPAWAKDWLETADVSMPIQNHYQGASETARLNEYYVANPDQMIGEMVLRSGRYGDKLEPGLMNEEPGILAEKLPGLVEALPADVMAQFVRVIDPEPERKTIEAEGEIRQGAVHVRDGKVYQREGKRDVEWKGKVSDKALDAIQRFGGLRDNTMSLIRAQLENVEADEIKALRKNLNTAYDAFVKKHGAINKAMVRSPFREDPDANRVLALEKWDPATKTATKADIFRKNTLTPRDVPTSAGSPADALTISLNQRGRVDMDYMSKLTGMSVLDLAAELRGTVFLDPQGSWQTAEEYLSGNVREKLRIAETAAATDPRYAENVEALKANQPEDLGPADIVPRLGASWIEGDDVAAYMAAKVGGDPESYQATFVEAGDIGKWLINPAASSAREVQSVVRQRAQERKRGVEATKQWGTERKNFFDLLENGLNGQFPTVYDRDAQGNTHVNVTQTEAARAKLDEIKADFNTWLWDDTARATLLVKRYNEQLNATVLRQFDGSHLQFPGMAADFVALGGLRQHQRNAVWRILSNPSTYLAHEVGTGKTLTYVAAAMEARRLGIARKPALAVLKKNLDQIATDFRQAYPAANLLVIEVPENAQKRKAAVAQIATGDWDAVILTHESMGKIGVSAARQIKEYNEQLGDLLSALSIAEEGSGKRDRNVREMEKVRERLKAKLDDLQKRVDKDDGFTFEDTGIDFLMVDEAQQFKNLMFHTGLGRQIRGLSPQGSGRSFELFMKSKYLHERGARFVMGSGTPLSNSIGELFTISRYLQLDELKALKLHYFDTWANTFGDAAAVMEYMPEGGGFRQVTKFKAFVNVADLQRMVYGVMDLATAEGVGIERPTIEGDKPKPVVLDMTEAQAAIARELGGRAKNIRRNPKDALPDNMLVVSAEGVWSSIDMRLLGSEYGEGDGSKLPKAADNVLQLYKETDHFKGTQIVFLDQRSTTRNPDFNTHEALKEILTDRGIPADEITAIHDVDGESKTAKARQAQLFADVNSGKVRVLIATTQKGGTGVNVQERVAALHHLDVDWNFSGYIQRNGRGLRQGNLVEEKYGWKLRIFNYTTEGSVDAFKWDKVAGKARLFERIMNGDMSQRIVEDISQETVSAAEMVAITSGDPRIAEFQSLQIDVARLSTLHRAHQDAQWRVRTDIANIPQQIESTRERIGRREANIAALEKIGSVAVKQKDGTLKEYSLAAPAEDADPKQVEKAAEVMRATWRAAIERAKAEVRDTENNAMMAEYRGEGVTLPVWIEMLRDNWFMSLEMPHGAFEGGGEALAPRKLALALQSEQRDLTSSQEDVERFSSDLGKLQAQSGKDFPKQKELDTKNARIAELRAYFAAQEKKDNAQAPGDVQASIGLTANFKRSRDDVIREIEAMARRMNPDVDVEIVEQLFLGDEEARRASGATDDTGEVAGLFWRGANLIQVALDTPEVDPVSTAAHELWHSLEEMLTPEEQSILREEFPAVGQLTHEEATAYAYETWYASRGVNQVGFLAAVQDIFRRIARFFRAIKHALAGRGFKTAEDIFEEAERGDIGARRPARKREPTLDRTVQAAAARRPKRRREPILSFEDPQTQREWDIGQLGLEGQRKPVVNRVWEYVKDFGQLWVRSHRNLPREAQFADAYAYLRSIKAAPSVATEEVVRFLHDLTRDMDQAELELFTMKALVDDLQHDVARGMEIPIFRDYDDLAREKARVDAEIAKRPDLEKLVHRRRRYVNDVKRRMIAAGMLSNDEASNPAYFRHQVLEYAAVSHAFGGQNKVRKPKIFRRKGTKLSINTKLVEVEAEWLFRAIVGIETMEQLDNIQERYDSAPDIRKRIRAHNKAAMEDLVQREIAEVGESGPIQEKLQQYRRNIAIGFKMIRGDDKIETDDLPKHLQDDFDKLVTGRGDGERDFQVIAWIAQNSDTEAGGGAGLVLKEVNSRRQFLKDTVGERYISPQDLDGALAAFGIEDQRTWQPDEGHIYFLAKPVPQRVMDSFIKKLAVNLGQQSGHFTNEEVAELLKMVQEQIAAGVGRGKKPQMVLPTELADTLDEMGGIQESSWIDELTTRLIRLHKQWLLISPRSWARYNIQNISGDFDGALAAFPASINPRKYMGPAIKELWQVQVKRGEPSEAYLEAARRGVFDAGWSINEAYEAEANIGDVMALESLTRASMRKVWRFFSRSTTFRENWLRYAMYMAVKDKILEAESKHPGKAPDVIMPMVGYGAARRVMVDATKDPRDRAALIARESIGDYGDLSVAGDYLRRRWLWFFSWQEINFKRYMRLGTNIWLTQKGFGKAQALSGLGARVGTRAALWLAFRATIFFLAVNLWNHLMFPDEEDELSQEDRWRLHIILGRDADGKVVMIRLPGALSDFLSIFGYTDVMQFIYEAQSGRGNVEKLLEDVILAPINRIVQGVTPILKVPIEALTGKSVFPKFWEPRTIKDPWRHIFRTFKAEHEYDAILGRPSRGYGESWIEAVIARREPDESAYHFIRGLGYDWKKTVKGESFSGGVWSERARALYYWRMALRYGDQDAATRFRKELRRLKADVQASRRAAHPLGMLSKVDRRRFLRTLTDEERERLRRGIRWYNEVM